MGLTASLAALLTKTRWCRHSISRGSVLQRKTITGGIKANHAVHFGTPNCPAKKVWKAMNALIAATSETKYCFASVNSPLSGAKLEPIFPELFFCFSFGSFGGTMFRFLR